MHVFGNGMPDVITGRSLRAKRRRPRGGSDCEGLDRSESPGRLASRSRDTRQRGMRSTAAFSPAIARKAHHPHAQQADQGFGLRRVVSPEHDIV